MSEAESGHDNTIGTSRGSDLLATKLYARAARANLVARPRITRLLDEGLSASLILVSAPAGFGKTTLIADWLGSRPHRSCWLSLDGADNDPMRFLSYVIAALQKAVPGVASDLAAPLHSPQPPPAEAVITALVNELASLPGPLVLVLDDYHFITSTAVNGAVTLLLENLPPSLHLVISTRADPPIPIARLRSRGQVAEVRTDDLRFTPDEAAAFLNQTMGLALSPVQVAALDERTEGWIAGLQMAALSMRGRDDVDGFIQAFAGTNRFILDFLVEEVLSREPEGVQTFLLQTAILTRLSGPLCDAVTGTSGGQEMLEGLERRNLFVVPLDDDRRWYRYHHLFADLLAARLRQTGPGQVAVLHVRAATWYDAQGLPEEAVRHALAAEDYPLAGRLAAKYWQLLAHSGQTNTVLGWLEALPTQVARNDPLLSLAHAWLLLLTGEMGEIDDWLDATEQALAMRRADDDPQLAPVPSAAAALRSNVARHRGEIPRAAQLADKALAFAEQARGVHPAMSALLRSTGYGALGQAYRESGQTAEALTALQKVIPLARAGGNPLNVAICGFYVVRLQQALGRLRDAEQTCRQALQTAERDGYSGWPAAGLLYLALAEVLRELNELPEADRHLERGELLVRQGGYMEGLRNLGIVQARLRQARGDLAGALASLDEAEVAMRQAAMPLGTAEVLAYRARVQLALGDLTSTERWAEEAKRRPGEDCGYTREVEDLTYGRLLLVRGEHRAAADHLRRCLDRAEAGGRRGSAIEVQVLLALAKQWLGQDEAALSELGRALATAAPEGYVRVFLDEGTALYDLLRHGRERGPWCSGPAAEHVHRLLALVPTEAGLPKDRQAGTASGLVESLSERELEVLRLLAEGFTNQQIAATLIIALGTVKAHVHNISGKLGAENRAHAVARAKELGLL